jgi:16S rRNA C967 or C1407 C5-methylase (RsmB/RsmF family)/transcription termination factor NusB
MTAAPRPGAGKTAPKNRPAEISPARKAAFAILMAVERGQSHSDDLLRGKAVNALSAPDRNLATALVLGVLRWQIRLDRQLQALLKRPNGKLDPEIRIALRLGAFQILHMDRIPARAAIDESVELGKQAGHRFASGMVNAVLRKLAGAPQAAEELPALHPSDSDPSLGASALKGHGFSRAVRAPSMEAALAAEGMRVVENEPPQGLKSNFPFCPSDGAAEAAPFQGEETAPSKVSFAACFAPEGSLPEESATEVALAFSHPAWMVERWAGFYGLEATRDLCRYGQSQPSLTLRIVDPAVEDELAASGIHLQPGELLTAARTVVSGDLTASPAFREGRLRLQDEGSQLVAELASIAVANPNQKGKNVLDACAAPGNKTLILAERNPAARILACESSPQRFEPLRKRLAPLGDRVECRLIDAATLAEDSGFDLALVDAPCSGTGTLGRNPEIRHRLRLEDLRRQAERQRAILLAALRAVRPGGRVLYSTCSLEPEENEQVVAAVLAETEGARQVSLESGIHALLAQGILTSSGAERLKSSLTPQGALRLLPGALATDGFFICLLERVASKPLHKPAL